MGATAGKASAAERRERPRVLASKRPADHAYKSIICGSSTVLPGDIAVGVNRPG
jgi:hypothetical protein